jgi:hypothetical protein
MAFGSGISFCSRPGLGAVVDTIGDSRARGWNTTRGDGFRYPLALALPLAHAVGAVTDAYGAKHDGTNGATSASIAAACAASGALLPTPTHVPYWCGFNDVYTITPADSRANTLANMTALIDDASAPHVLFIREMRLPVHLPEVAATFDGWTRGQAAWAANALVDIQVGLVRGVRFAVIDPVWVYPDDYLLGYDIHQSDDGVAKLGAALARAVRWFPVSGASTPRTVSQATVQTALGADLLHAFDGRDTPTEVTGLMSAWDAFVGGESLVQGTAGARPTWTGGAAATDGARHMTCGNLRPGSGAWTIVVQCQPYVTGSVARETMATISTSGVEHVAIGMTDTDVVVEIENATRRTRMSFPYVFGGGVPACITATYDVVSQTTPGSYTCRVNGVDLGAPTLTHNDAADYSAQVGPSALGAYYRGGAAVQSWQAGTLDGLLVAAYGLSTAKRDALEAFAAAVIT